MKQNCSLILFVSLITLHYLFISGVPGAGPDPNNEDAPRKGSGKTDEGESNEPQIAGSSSETKDTKPETGAMQ